MCWRERSLPESWYVEQSLLLFKADSSRYQPTSENPLPPPQALAALRTELLDTFKEEFQKAAASRDEQTTSRFFKLFPTIGAEVSSLKPLEVQREADWSCRSPGGRTNHIRRLCGQPCQGQKCIWRQA